MKTNIKAKIGSRLRSLRAKRGWTQADAAYKFGVSQGRLSHFESGNMIPTIETLYRIVAELKCRWVDVLGNPKEK